MTQHSKSSRGRKAQGRSDGSHRLRLSPRTSSTPRAQSRQAKEDVSAARQQGSSQPELRLRAPKRPRSQSYLSPDEKRKIAERELAAGRPGSSSAKGLEAKRRTTSRRSLANKSSPLKSISHKDKDPLAKSSGLGKIEGSQESVGLNGKNSSRRTTGKKTKEQREAERKQLQRKSKQRAYVLRLSNISIGIVLALALLIWGVVAFINSELFYPSDIEVQNARFLSEDDVRNIAAVDMQSSTITMDTAELEDRLIAHPWIMRANVSTRFPSNVVIEVFERTPAVELEVGGVSWIASSDGKWLGYLNERNTQIFDPTGSVGAVGIRAINIIPVTGIAELEPEWGERTDDESLLNVLAHLRGLDSRIISRVSRVSAPEVGRTSLFTIDEVELDVGRADDLDEKSAIILRILEREEGNVVLINVRSIINPHWRGLSR